jgi:hypothetical protein
VTLYLTVYFKVRLSDSQVIVRVFCKRKLATANDCSFYEIETFTIFPS